jgi:histidyl-tRNA synthetase
MSQDKQPIRAPRGTEDILPEQLPLQRFIEDTARRVMELYGYREIRTPVFEDTGLYARTTGETTDIVEKEMFSINAGQEGSFVLRPEGTPGVVRAYVEHEVYKVRKFEKFHYIYHIFRYERPQAGRMRQFDQIGAEAIGSYDPLVDAETILLAAAIFDAIGLEGCKIRLNSFGCEKCRPAYRVALRKAVGGKEDGLCANCRRRLDRNIFRLLDCKEERCKEITTALPSIREYLDDDCRTHFAKVCETLDANGIVYQLEDRLVRGLDYYTKTVYEFAHESLGARDAVCGGGRYDGLVEQLGGPPTGGVGFAIGVVPTLLALKNTGKDAPAAAVPKGLTLFLATIGDEDRPYCFSLLRRLRAAGVAADLDFEGRSLKAQMRAANRAKARYVIVVGPDERASKKFKLKEMATGKEEIVTEGALLSSLER